MEIDSYAGWAKEWVPVAEDDDANENFVSKFVSFLLKKDSLGYYVVTSTSKNAYRVLFNRDPLRVGLAKIDTDI